VVHYTPINYWEGRGRKQVISVPIDDNIMHIAGFCMSLYYQLLGGKGMKQVISIPIVDTTIRIILHFIFIHTTFNQICSFYTAFDFQR